MESEKADYTTLERIRGLSNYAGECPEVLARYLHEFCFCIEPHSGCTGKSCENCIAKWLSERADK